jgi:hypothetical protein
MKMLFAAGMSPEEIKPLRLSHFRCPQVSGHHYFWPLPPL